LWIIAIVCAVRVRHVNAGNGKSIRLRRVDFRAATVTAAIGGFLVLAVVRHRGMLRRWLIDIGFDRRAGTGKPVREKRNEQDRQS